MRAPRRRRSRWARPRPPRDRTRGADATASVKPSRVPVDVAEVDSARSRSSRAPAHRRRASARTRRCSRAYDRGPEVGRAGVAAMEQPQLAADDSRAFDVDRRHQNVGSLGAAARPARGDRAALRRAAASHSRRSRSSRAPASSPSRTPTARRRPRRTPRDRASRACCRARPRTAGARSRRAAARARSPRRLRHADERAVVLDHREPAARSTSRGPDAARTCAGRSSPSGAVSP